MSEVDAVYSVAYVLLSICLIAPPTEFVSLGLTVQNVLAGYLGSEDMNFIYYHIKRTTATLIFHSLLPLGIDEKTLYKVSLCHTLQIEIC